MHHCLLSCFALVSKGWCKLQRDVRDFLVGTSLSEHAAKELMVKGHATLTRTATARTIAMGVDILVVT